MNSRFIHSKPAADRVASSNRAATERKRSDAPSRNRRSTGNAASLVDSAAPASPRGLKPAAHPVRAPVPRGATVPARRGSVLVLVMTVLGLLFVTGLAFMATMNFQAEMMAADESIGRMEPGMTLVAGGVEEMISETILPDVADGFTGTFAGRPLHFAELPGYDNSFSPIEPMVDPVSGAYLFNWAVDVKAMTEASTAQVPAVAGSSAKEFLGSTMSLVQKSSTTLTPPVDTAWVPGDDTIVFPAIYSGYTPLDADGDGISDSIAAELNPGAFDRARGSAFRLLQEAVNPPTGTSNKVFLGLRVIPHGGMVNLGASHPLLIHKVMGSGRKLERPDDFQPPYDPAVEEPSLRRRNFLPPPLLPPTRIQGNPLGRHPDTGGGDFAAELFPPGETLHTGKHRYWPFLPNEFGPHPDIPLWAIRMDPFFWSDDPANDPYDRRHLVTSVSHDDLFRRPVHVVATDAVGHFAVDGSYGRIEGEALDLMREANLRPPIISTCSWSTGVPSSELPFEYANYPYTVPNQLPGGVGPKSTPFDPYDTCACLSLIDPTLANCRPNPRKGQLRLSLPWLDTLLRLDDSFADPNLRRRGILLIQDAFTLMLLNARGSDWGSYKDELDPGSGLVTGRKVWTWVDSRDVAFTAASLTANLIDFADADDDPTRVELRSADFTNLGTVGRPFTPPEYVWGIERQPYITEVVSVAVEQAPAGSALPDPGNSLYGVELFNPSDRSLSLIDYYLKVGLNPLIPLSSYGLGPREFVGFHTGSISLIPTPKGRFVLIGPPAFVFDEGDTIKLVRIVGGFEVTVDQFDLNNGEVGKLQPPGMGVMRSIERPATGGALSKWLAPIPVPATLWTDKPTFGLPYPGLVTDVSPVQVELANVGTLSEAFPTTGMLLLLMRHGNTTGTAFTARLTDSYTDSSGSTRTAIDNGRMPIFDLGERHHLTPRIDPFGPLDSLTGENVSLDRSGDVMHLPWGQLVFDYFTALPLSSPGPFTHDASTGDLVIDQHAGPKVDLDGLRVHGRINLNAAPWKVLEGLPVVALDRIYPDAVRVEFRNTLGITNDKVPTTLGETRAKAIVAYRELRELDGLTGNYADGSLGGTPALDTGRGWSVASPSVRRGSGLLSVGELANIRHQAATVEYRFDARRLFPGDPFLQAVAPLATLADWTCVRSQVFTVYGVIRGEEDPSIEDPLSPINEKKLRIREADSRAWRLQTTIDRLPMLTGATAPSRIGDRVLTRYLGAQGD